MRAMAQLGRADRRLKSHSESIGDEQASNELFSKHVTFLVGRHFHKNENDMEYV